MKIYREFQKLDEPITISIGTYDAIHCGHIEIIQKMKDFGLKTCIISFYPPPFIHFELEKFVLFTLEEKIKIFEELKIDFIFFIDFNDKIKNLSSEDFIKILISNFNIKYLIVGKLFRFGRNKEGDRFLLEKLSKKYDFQLKLIEEKKFGKEKISSSKIRNLIKIGDIETANKFLYKNYFIITKKENDKLIIDSLKLLPPDGVYLVNINDEKNKKIEISRREIKLKEDLDFNEIKIEFLKKLS